MPDLSLFARDTHRGTRIWVGVWAQIVGDGVVTGQGEVNGRTVFVFSQDFTRYAPWLAIEEYL
jgi:acetyl-CoA carboxylase carboxyltransferase component